MTIVDKLWAQIEPAVFITRGQFERELVAWEIEPVDIDGELAFAVLRNGPEIHWAIFGTGAQLTMVMMRDWINPTLARYGFAVTRTLKEDVRQQRINRRMGCHVTGESEYFIHYRLDRCPS